jgi:hypothetical protein
MTCTMEKTVHARGLRSLALLGIALNLISLHCARSASGQVNSWLKPTSGNWEEMQWSLGILPGAGQSIQITNEGWKSVQIWPNTQNYPASLTVDSITLFSPVDTHNALLLNYPGQQVPLTARLFTISSNSTVTLLNATLNLNGSSGQGLSVGGQFFQDISSSVLGQQMDIGYVGPGVYNLVSGNVWLQHIWIGGPYSGRMLQTGGTNGSGIVHIESGGEYDLVDGDYNAADTYFDNGGVLRQTGGRINNGLRVYQGTYLLQGGVIKGGILIPTSDGYSVDGGNSFMVQTGGTNDGGLSIGEIGGYGTYVLSNGVSFAAGLTVGPRGNATQWGGAQIISGSLSTTTEFVVRNIYGYGSYNLNAGSLSADSMNNGGHYAQSGGTNVIAGTLQLAGVYADLKLNGGELRCDIAYADYSWSGGWTQNGGRCVISNQLSVDTDYLAGWHGFILNGGTLVVSNILLSPGSVFTKTGGILNQSGLLMLQSADLYLGAGNHSFGRLALQTRFSTQTNSILHLPDSGGCVVTFADSSQIPWDDTAMLTISNWNGSWSGGGSQQVRFGSGSGALTLAQLSQIYFQNPSGFSAGLYPVRILSSGELVPNAEPPSGHPRPVLSLARQSSGAMQITLQGEATARYEIEVSTNLQSWASWTNVSTVQGAATISDLTAAAWPRRFYRAVLLQ